jgi:hypothetical protein
MQGPAAPLPGPSRQGRPCLCLRRKGAPRRGWPEHVRLVSLLPPPLFELLLLLLSPPTSSSPYYSRAHPATIAHLLHHPQAAWALTLPPLCIPVSDFIGACPLLSHSHSSSPVHITDHSHSTPSFARCCASDIDSAFIVDDTEGKPGDFMPFCCVSWGDLRPPFMFCTQISSCSASHPSFPFPSLPLHHPVEEKRGEGRASSSTGIIRKEHEYHAPESHCLPLFLSFRFLSAPRNSKRPSPDRQK